MTIDRQLDEVFWWTIRAWSKRGKSRRLGFGKAFSFAELEETRHKFKVEPCKTLCDSGYKPKGDHGVYTACIRYGWVPVKGAAQENGDAKFFWHQVNKNRVLRSYSEPILCDPEVGNIGQDQYAIERIDFSSPTFADRVQNQIDLGLWEEPQAATGDPIEVQYRKQMAGEYKKRIVVGALKKEKMVWHCPSGNNHAFDCAKMQALGATILGILPDELPEAEAA
jgi:hypothetical protein